VLRSGRQFFLGRRCGTVETRLGRAGRALTWGREAKKQVPRLRLPAAGKLGMTIFLGGAAAWYREGPRRGGGAHLKMAAT
jgi:hypothetical protein